MNPLSQDWKRELVEIFFARLRIILWTTFLVFAGAVAIAVLWPPTYAASATIMMRGRWTQPNPEALERTLVRSVPISREDLATEIEIVTSPDLIKEALLDLRDRPGSMYATASDHRPTPPRAARADSAAGNDLLAEIKEVRANLQTEVIPASKAIKVALFDRDMNRAEIILDTILDHYIRFRARVFNPVDQERFFGERAEMYRHDVESLENELVAKAGATSITLVQNEMKKNLDLKGDLEKTYNVLSGQKIEKIKEIEPLEKAIAAGGVQYFSFLNNLSINDLSDRLMVLTAEREALLRAYRPDSDKVRAITESVDQISGMLRAEAQRILAKRRAELEAIEEQMAFVRASASDLEARNIELQAHLTKLERLERELMLARESYETFTRRREEARINNATAAASISTNVSLLSRAAASGKRVTPAPIAVIALGLLIGFVAGLSLAFVVEYLDHAFKRPSDVTRYAGLPVICSIKRA